MLSLPTRSSLRHPLHLSTVKLATAATSTPTSGSRMMNQTPTSSAVPGQTEDFNDSKHSAYLGEADSNDGHEAFLDAYGPPQPALETDHAAFLGEADSDDAFEARKAVEGDTYESLDASQAAYLGEADSDDGFEADVEINPEKYRHKIEDPTPSGFHGETGQHDQ